MPGDQSWYKPHTEIFTNRRKRIYIHHCLQRGKYVRHCQLYLVYQETMTNSTDKLTLYICRYDMTSSYVFNSWMFNSWMLWNIHSLLLIIISLKWRFSAHWFLCQQWQVCLGNAYLSYYEIFLLLWYQLFIGMYIVLVLLSMSIKRMWNYIRKFEYWLIILCVLFR